MRSNQALEGGAPQVISLSYFIYKLQLPIESYRYIMIIYHRPQLRTNSACLHSGITLCQVVTLKAALKPSGQGSLILLLVLLGVLVATSKLLETAGNSTLGILQDVDLPFFLSFFFQKKHRSHGSFLSFFPAPPGASPPGTEPLLFCSEMGKIGMEDGAGTGPADGFHEQTRRFCYETL